MTQMVTDEAQMAQKAPQRVSVVSLVPSRLNSDRVPRKNVRPLGGVPLVNYVTRTLNRVPLIDETVLFASEPSICSYLQPGVRVKFVRRSSTLDVPTTSIQDIIRAFLDVYPVDIVVNAHITAPFLRPETIAECVEAVRSGKHDSAFTAFAVKKFCWLRGVPLNYSLSEPTPRTQDIDPVVVEHSLYVFRSRLFRETGRRISAHPYIKIIDHFEGHDIDTEEDFKIAELIVNTGLYTLR